MPSIQTVRRYHDISCGHRVVGHEGKCRGLHGHNYRIHFECAAEKLDEVGRVIDFSVIKEKLCMWLEDNWDHKMLLWEDDPLCALLGNPEYGVATAAQCKALDDMAASVVSVPFNPTAENMATYLLGVVGPIQLVGTGVRLITVHISETMKCSATARISE
jgi:6-pyruvoyltetrahydropterin/6-carboxytetrahydropterin synthase